MGVVALTLAGGVLPASVANVADASLAVADAIRQQALRPNHDGAGRPLPLAAHWNMGIEANGFTPAYQMQMIARGHHLLPWFHTPDAEMRLDGAWLRYYEPIKRVAELQLPLALVGTQWEHPLTDDPAYFDRAPRDNPNVVGTDGRVQRQVSPFGPVTAWREVGRRWTSSPTMKKLQEWYPDPPRVLFVSNNEHARLPWSDAATDGRYRERYGRGRDDDFTRRVVGDGWIERYRALQDGMRQGLTSAAWRANAVFIGYDAFGPPHFGRMPRWRVHSLYVPGRIAPWPLAWDGGSPSFYVFNWNASTDYTVHSPQIEAMNWPFMQAEAERVNPEFWLELSTWDGHEPAQPNDKRKTYAERGQTFTPDRYGGMVQFGLWLLRPRSVREFRGWTDTLANAEPYFIPIVRAVDRVHASPTLRAFWQRGRLVANRAHRHPYQRDIPPEYREADRWFLLDTNLDPRRPWSLHTELPVLSLALVLGQPPRRRWLLCAHAPLGDRRDVAITVPEHRPVRVDVSVAGSFYLVDEAAQSVEAVR